MRAACLLTSSVLAGVLLSFGCSDGGGGLLIAPTSFRPDPRTPAAGQVYLDLLGSSNDQARVTIRVRDVADLAAAELILDLDPTAALFRGFEPGDLFESAGPAVSYSVVEPVAGRLTIDVRRPDGASVTAGAGDPVLVVIRLQSTRTGLSRVDFNPASKLVDGTSAAIAGVVFFGGTLDR